MSTELIKVEEFTSLMKSAPDALGKNQKSIANCNSAGQAILDTIQGEGMTDELDAKAAEYLKKVNVTITNMKSRRAPVTQLFDRIRSIFTTDEKAIDPKDKSTIPGKIAAERDRYAALKREEERRKQQEMQRQANIEKEKGTYRFAIEQAINTHMSSYFAEQQKNLSHIWESITLATFELKEKSIIITNPPYGERISTNDLLGLYQMIGERLKHAFAGNDAWILGYREECFDQIGLKPSVKVPLFNGALECEFRKYQLFDGKYKEFRTENKDRDFKPRREDTRPRRNSERVEYGERRERRNFDDKREGRGDFKNRDRKDRGNEERKEFKPRFKREEK